MDGTTGIVLATIGALVAVILGILNYVSKRNECENQKGIKQAEFDIKLASIERELVEIKSLLVTSIEKYGILEKRVFVLETERPKSRKKENDNE